MVVKDDITGFVAIYLSKPPPLPRAPCPMAKTPDPCVPELLRSDDELAATVNPAALMPRQSEAHIMR